MSPAKNEDWRYSDDRMDVRTQGLNILLKKFGRELSSDGSPRYSNQGIYECIHDWVSQGNKRTDGIVAYYKAYYADQQWYTSCMFNSTGMLILISEEHGCAYSVDAEGTLFYTPQMVGGAIDAEDWSEVDHMAMLGEEQQIQDQINEVHQQLIVANQALGWYYTDVPIAV